MAWAAGQPSIAAVRRHQVMAHGGLRIPAGAAAVALVTACSVPSQPLRPADPPTTPSAAACSGGALALQSVATTGFAQGGENWVFRFVNTSSRACVMDGYPALSVARPGGSRIEIRERHTRQLLDGQRDDVKPVLLAPGGSALFNVVSVAVDRSGVVPCSERFTRLSATAPGDTRSLVDRAYGSTHSAFIACNGQTIAVTPLYQRTPH